MEFLKDALRLRWAFEPIGKEDHKGIDIPRSVPFQFDVFSSQIDMKSKQEIFIETASKYAFKNLANKLRLGNRYRFWVRIVAANADPISVVMIAEIGTEKNEVRVSSIRQLPDLAGMAAKFD